MVVAILAGAVGVGGAALAGEGGRWKKVPITFALAGEIGTELTGTACLPSNRCVYLVKVTGATLTGDLEGASVEGIAGAEGGTFTSTGMFDGTVKACGTGTFEFTNGGNAFSATRVYKIAPGSGTGDLAGITGSWVPASDAPTASGWVRCKVR